MKHRSYIAKQFLRAISFGRLELHSRTEEFGAATLLRFSISAVRWRDGYRGIEVKFGLTFTDYLFVFRTSKKGAST